MPPLRLLPALVRMHVCTPCQISCSCSPLAAECSAIKQTECEQKVTSHQIGPGKQRQIMNESERGRAGGESEGENRVTAKRQGQKMVLVN
jgi:hypothetical protein